MEILRRKESGVRTDYYAGDLSYWNTGTPFLTPYQRSSFLSVELDDSTNYGVYPHKFYITSFPRVSYTEVNGRQRNPNDTPPGVGYFELAKSNSYIPITTLTKSTVLVENPFQILDHNDVIEEKGGGCLWTAGPFMDVLKYANFQLNPDPYPQVEIFTAADELAIRNLYASLGKRTKINGGVLLGEMKESMGLLGKACTALLLTVREIKRGRIDKAIKVISEYVGTQFSDRTIRGLSRERINRSRRKNGDKPISKSDYASNSWLELQFGWLPIVNDIYDIISYLEEAKKGLETEGVWLSFSGYSGTHSYNYVTRDLPGYRAWSRLYGLEITQKRDIRIAYTATFKVSDPLADVLNSVGLANPASVAWELVPFSFILDWFLPVGDWIESFTAHAGLEVIEVCRSVKVTDTVTTNGPSRDYGGYASPDSLEYLFLSGIRSKPGVPFRYFRQSFHRSTTGTNYDGSYSLPPFPSAKIDLEQIFQPWKLITSLSLYKALSGKR